MFFQVVFVCRVQEINKLICQKIWCLKQILKGSLMGKPALHPSNEASTAQEKKIQSCITARRCNAKTPMVKKRSHVFLEW